MTGAPAATAPAGSTACRSDFAPLSLTGTAVTPIRTHPEAGGGWSVPVVCPVSTMAVKRAERNGRRYELTGSSFDRTDQGCRHFSSLLLGSSPCCVERQLEIGRLRGRVARGFTVLCFPPVEPFLGQKGERANPVGVAVRDRGHDELVRSGCFLEPL
jgi:hypothetical protein